MLIYVIIDELIITRTFENFLRDLGHNVITFNSVSEFLLTDQRSNNPCELIIVELDMPKAAAVKEISEIHKIVPNTPILVMSSILPSHDAIINGVFSYLKKPISFAELELIIARVSERNFSIKPESFNDNHNNDYRVNKKGLSDTHKHL